MSNLFYRSSCKAACFIGILLAGTCAAFAQAVASGNRGAEISTFAQTALIHPDWGPVSNYGYTVGVDYTRFIRSIVQPSLELRMTRANGSAVGENTYTGGLKLETTFHHIHPYGTFLAGSGTITFTHPQGWYYHDGSFVTSLGGGAEFPVTSLISMRIDYTHQQWNIDPDTLTPTTLGAGLSYRLPFARRGVR